MDLSEYLKAREELLTAGNPACQQFFADNGYVLEYAYAELIFGNPEQAKKIFLSIAGHDIRAHWGAFLSSMCMGKLEGYPSYMELRNFFEIDLQLLFTYYIGNYVENICNYSDWLFTINPEIYKYIGRVFLKNDYIDIGLNFLKRGKDKFFNDPELHYLLAEYYFRTNKHESAEEYINNCLMILPEYYPAISLRQKLNNNC
ncbi:MAG: hypothetical protein VZR09_07000 [Candidatus Gastranaerophilaceae bacterium]|nr:hypothetical protein [Candidatus Gastranaerophilaceae bacterium]